MNTCHGRLVILAAYFSFICLAVPSAFCQEDDYYLRRVIPQIDRFEQKLEGFDSKEEYQIRRIQSELRVIVQTFERAESSSPSFEATKKRVEALAKRVEELSAPEEMPELELDPAEMEKKYGGRYAAGELKMPDSLSGNLTGDRAAEILEYGKAIKAVQDEIAKELPVMKKNEEVFQYQIKHADYLASEVSKQHEALVQRLSGPVQGLVQRLKFASESDLSNRSHVLNRIGDSSRQQIAELRGNAEPLLELALELEALMGTNLGTIKLKQQHDEFLGQYLAKVELVAGGKLTELPTAINKPELLEIAGEVLKKEQYGIDGWEKLIVNSDKKSKQRTTYEVSGDTIEKIVRDWDEFQVTTVEEEGGKYYVYYNTLAFYRSGASTTPTDRWILATRFKSAEISKENAGIK